MRLIDADELKQKYFGKRGGLIHTSDIDNAPTIDAVEIVRCKYCKHRLRLEATDCYPAEYICRLDERVFLPSRKANDPDWFCADGERKEE